MDVPELGWGPSEDRTHTADPRSPGHKPTPEGFLARAEGIEEYRRTETDVPDPFGS